LCFGGCKQDHVFSREGRAFRAYHHAMLKREVIPEGLRVLPDGSWRVGDLPISHPRRLKFLKQRLTFEDSGAFVVDGQQRMPILVEGPPFQVEALVFDLPSGDTRVRLDDGTEERLEDPVIRMNAETGQFECGVKGGRARAVLSGVAHERLLDEMEQEGGEFFVPVGALRCRILP
jgi:hypothetical protein